MIETLTIFYTGELAGDLARLPRLYTYLQAQKQAIDPSALLIDIGGACASDVWHCAATEGRSTLIVLDGMGYHAANVGGYLDTSEFDALKSALTTGLVDDAHAWRYHVPPTRDEGIIVSGAEAPALTLCIIAAPAETTHLNGRSLYLQAVAADEIGMVQINVPNLTIQAASIEKMPAKLKPDATIAASVEFVEEEARFYQRRAGKTTDNENGAG